MLACERGFLKHYLTEKQNSHLQSGCFTGGGRLREGVALITYLKDINYVEQHQSWSLK